jgi:hypothetical protein
MPPISPAAIRLAASALVSSANQAANDRGAAGSPTRKACLGVGALLALAFICVMLAVRNPEPIIAAVAGAFGS